MGKPTVTVPLLNAVSQRTASQQSSRTINGTFADFCTAGGKREDRLHDVFVEPTSTRGGVWLAGVHHLSDFELAGLAKPFRDVNGEEAWKCLAMQLARKVAQRTRELHALNIELERALEQICALKEKFRLENTVLREEISIARGGLAPWQAQRAKSLMDANLAAKLPLSQLAEECGLSTRHFARAFRQSTGVPPHRWLLGRRVDRAKDLLHDPALSLAEVALACGFADQSHFTRMFTTVVGLSPGVWRRTQSSHPPGGGDRSIAGCRSERHNSESLR